jgi:hypothetical protein
MIWANHRIPDKLLGQRFKVVEGDRWALIRWSFRYGPMIEDSHRDLGKLLAAIPDCIHDGYSERLSVCEVLEWVMDTKIGHDYIPTKIKTLYEIEWYADPEDEVEVEEDEVVA